MCENCHWEDHLEKLDELIDDPDAEWALVTLDGIRGWIDEHRHITANQRRAISNIRAAAKHTEPEYRGDRSTDLSAEYDDGGGFDFDDDIPF